MTLRQAKQIVKFLLEPELYDQYADKLNSFFDMGQKRIAATTDFIERQYIVTVDQPITIDMEQVDERFYKLRKVTGGAWDKLTQTTIRLQKGQYTVTYNVYPHTITEHTLPEYAFEVSEHAQTALPYYVAAQVSISEHDLRYHQVYSDEFASILENVDAARANGTLHFTKLGGTL